MRREGRHTRTAILAESLARVLSKEQVEEEEVGNGFTIPPGPSILAAPASGSPPDGLARKLRGPASRMSSSGGSPRGRLGQSLLAKISSTGE